MTVPLIRCEKCGQGMRSYPQLKRFMKLRSVAFKHWPGDHYFQPDNEEHLRAWLIVKTGIGATVRELPMGMMIERGTQDKWETILRETLRAAGSYSFVDVDWNRIIVRSPVSMSYDTPHRIATDICRAVDDVIFDVFGVTSETLLKEAEKAA